MATRDLREVKETNYLEEEGVFAGKIIELEEKTSKAGNDMTELTVETAKGNAIVRLVWTEKAMGMAKGNLRALGLDVDTEIIDESKLVGLKCKVEVKYKMQKTKDTFGNATGEKKAEFPNVRFTTQDVTITDDKK